jgi:PAS domain S-box-containing protein
VPAFIATGVLVCCTICVAQVPQGTEQTVGATPQPKRVVVLYPETDGRPGNVLVDRGIRNALRSYAPGRVEIYNEYLDLTRFADEGSQQLIASYLRQKYAGRTIDVVIPGLAHALDFVLRFRSQLFSGVPIVFCAVEQREIETRSALEHVSHALGRDVVGIPMHFDLAPTLDLALQLHPNTRQVYVVVGAAKYDTDWEAQARRAFHSYEQGREFIYLSGLTIDQYMTRVAQLPEASIVYFLNVFEDAAGNAVVPADFVEQLAAVANAPVYGHVDTFIGRGIVGGRPISFEAQGSNAGRLAARILSGEDPASIGIAEPSTNAYQFDWRQLRRWGIDESALPQGSTVLFKQPTLWDDYKWHIVGAVSLCAVEAILIVGLLVERTKRRRAEDHFERAVEAATSGMILIGSSGKIVLVNAHIEKLFGYRRAELVGQSVDLLVPDRFRGDHAAHRDGFFAAPHMRHIGSGRDLPGRRKDGTEFPVEIGLNPIQTDFGQLVLASVIDVTERKNVENELRASYLRQKDLAGQLLTAQESERRRIARELHDDLNQGLALLAVELELLGQSIPKEAVAHACNEPPNSAPTPAGSETRHSNALSAKLPERLRALAARVKELSTSVHDLSHQLHPSKLEQLGLVAAVRSLCQELANGRSLAIEFTHAGLPHKIPEDVALCLYRIAQEALANVIKHSGAKHAGVDLSFSARTIVMRIVDDGVGFEPQQLPGAGGLGFVNMQERLYLVGGRVTIQSNSPGGTSITVGVPIGA